MTVDDFEQLLLRHRSAVERFVRFQIRHPADAEDVLQETLTAALRGFPQLREQESFRPWLIGIARNKCHDFLRRKYARPEVPLEDAAHIADGALHFAGGHDSLVLDTLDRLSPGDRELLRLCYWLELSQAEIARRLGIPLGTVKSRLHHARQRFRAAWPVLQKGEPAMPGIMPKKMPRYTITPSDLPPLCLPLGGADGVVHRPQAWRKAVLGDV